MTASENPIPSSPVLPMVFDGDHTIQFSCHRGVSCWNACCSNIDISLTPYDILRMKRHLGISSTEFLRDYTFPYELEKDGIAGVKLKPADGATHCRFMREEGCGIYADRPTACRYYPIALLSMRRQDEYVDRNSYAIVNEAHCKGHQEPRTLTIQAYREEQGLEEYDELARGWRQLVLKKKSSGATIGKPSLKSRQLFFMACYDIDTFRAFVSSDAFSQLFVLGAEEREMLLQDDVELLQFSFRFLKQVLFGEKSIDLDESEARERLIRWRARQEAIELEAAAARARLEAEMSEDTLGEDACPPDGKCSSN
jgi:Fe-S-cluster containining protein